MNKNILNKMHSIALEQHFEFNSKQEFIDRADWNKINKRNNLLKLSEDFVSEFSNMISFYNYSKKSDLSIEFIERFKEQIRWDVIISHFINIELLVEKFEKYISFDLLSYNRNLSESFIEKYQDRLDWKSICLSQDMSEDFIIKHLDKIDFDSLTKNFYINFSQKFFRRFSNEMGVKEYILPDGRNCFMQGYDNLYLDKVIYLNISKFNDPDSKRPENQFLYDSHERYIVVEMTEDKKRIWLEKVK